jgi:hypothetical protein
MTYVDGKQVRAPRAAYRHFKGQIADGMFVCHHCDNPTCVNPEHLFLGTVQDNSSDMVAKGRQARGLRNGAYTCPGSRQRGDAHYSRRHPETRRGVLNGRSVLNDEKVSQILARLARGEGCAALGREYGVSEVAIGHIKHRRQWRHVSPAKEIS